MSTSFGIALQMAVVFLGIPWTVFGILFLSRKLRAQDRRGGE